MTTHHRRPVRCRLGIYIFGLHGCSLFLRVGSQGHPRRRHAPSSPVSFGSRLLSSFRSAPPGHAYSQDRWGRTLVPGRSRQNNPPASAHGCRSVAGTGPIRSFGRPCSQSPPATAAFHSGHAPLLIHPPPRLSNHLLNGPALRVVLQQPHCAVRFRAKHHGGSLIVFRPFRDPSRGPRAAAGTGKHTDAGKKEEEQKNKEPPMKGVRQGQSSNRTKKKRKKERDGAGRRPTHHHDAPTHVVACKMLQVKWKTLLAVNKITPCRSSPSHLYLLQAQKPHKLHAAAGTQTHKNMRTIN
ncbi:hypothetical protein TCSYLVIO_007140 [Trypanosoma cruzi]|nr:hypothetical protein TCSYLVIO_007140 [Trypanosoma cruzi]